MNNSIYARLSDELEVEIAEFSSVDEASNEGYIPYEEQEKPVTPTGVIPHNYKAEYKEIDGKVVKTWRAYPNYEAIGRLKKKLASTDYQIIKCYEASLIKSDMPYNVKEIHAQRQEIRDEINRLEACE